MILIITKIPIILCICIIYLLKMVNIVDIVMGGG